MASVFKPEGSRKYVIMYYDENGKRRKKAGTTDKGVTERIARDIENRVLLRREGLIDARDDAYREYGAMPLGEHVDAWRGNLVAKGYTAKHADTSADRVRRLIAVVFGAKPDDVDGKANRSRKKQARATVDRLIARAKLSDITTERVQAALATLRESGRSAQTCNHYRGCVRAFARWAKRMGRLRDYPLDGVTGFNVKEDPRHERRTISLDELHHLIGIAEQGPVVMGVAGPVRALAYRLAVATGLRYSEIKAIRPESFDWKAPQVHVAACYTKNGEEAELPLPSDLVGDLVAYVRTLEPRAVVFPLPDYGYGAKMLRADLEAAGIPYVDASGQFFDFHSLRCQLATLADQAGVSPRVVQRLMRHSSLELTGRYTKPRVVDIENAASMIPSLKPSGDRPESRAMTGTDNLVFRPTATETAPSEKADTCNSVAVPRVASNPCRSTQPMTLKKVSSSNRCGQPL